MIISAALRLDDIALIVRIVEGDFADDQALHLYQIQAGIRLEREVNGAFELWLILWLVQILQEAVLQGLLNLDACLWVHVEHLVEEVYGLGRLVWKQLLQVYFRLLGQ